MDKAETEMMEVIDKYTDKQKDKSEDIVPTKLQMKLLEDAFDSARELVE